MRGRMCCLREGVRQDRRLISTGFTLGASGAASPGAWLILLFLLALSGGVGWIIGVAMR